MRMAAACSWRACSTAREMISTVIGWTTPSTDTARTRAADAAAADAAAISAAIVTAFMPCVGFYSIGVVSCALVCIDDWAAVAAVKSSARRCALAPTRFPQPACASPVVRAYSAADNRWSAAYNRSMSEHARVLDALGGEAGCKRLSAAFYARVNADPILRPLFPGKTLKCAIEEFGAFLIQFLGGDEKQTQRRWWLSLRESHGRFRIGDAERRAWLKHMAAALDAAPVDETTRQALMQFFECSSVYVTGREAGCPEHNELAQRWSEQRMVDEAIAAISAGRDDEAVALAPRLMSRPAVFTGMLARMMRSGRADLISYVLLALERDPSLATGRYGGRALLHYASGAGCLAVVERLLRLGTDPDIRDDGGRTPLYCAANECASEQGPPIARALVGAGADVNARCGVTRATALHMAARRGHVEIARVLLERGAEIDARDYKGCTPLQRAVNCRRHAVAQLLAEGIA